jgi:tetratricopeptide (TPR) repeat protein
VLTSTSSRRNRSRITTLLLVAALVTTALVYWPGTHGGYVFDDYPNIADNAQLHLHSLDWESLREAALSSPSPVLIRPLAMLSFGIDWYFGGGKPFAMKLVNLAIHLLNGLLLFALLRRVTRRALARESASAADVAHAEMLALCISAAWLLAPINFTAVSYIVQRMESLCQLFVLLGLCAYAGARERMLAGNGGFAMALAAVVLATVIGSLAKESAVLLPVYALLLEWALYGFVTDRGRPDKRLAAMYVVTLLIPACIAVVWVVPHFMLSGPWTGRPFTPVERLLSEPRILLDYVRWSLLPTPNALALYHDQIPVSHGLLDPPSTLLSMATLAAAACAAPLLRRAYPLAALGIAWFLSAHLLTGTIVPLELVFEHRNYFASIGLFLLLFSFLLPRPGAPLAAARAVACLALLLLYAGVTWIRALDWSNPVAFALSEAGKNPNSPRTAYELGRTYVVLSQYKVDSPLVPEAYSALEHAATMPGADVLPDHALLILAARLHQPTSPAVWERMQQKLATQPLSAQNISALYALAQCAVAGDCAFPAKQMVHSFVAALEHKPPNSRVLSIYADYAINILRDSTLAIDLAQEVLQHEPQSLQARRNLMLLLQTSGRHADAFALYEQTLHDVPEAKRDRAFAKWSEELFRTTPPPGAAESQPK